MTDGPADALTGRDGRVLAVRRWLPAGDQPRAVIQVVHGLAEHAGRYARFAEACAARGFAVVAHDHRGHGGHDGEPAAYFADRDGWARVVDDVLVVRQDAANRHPALPIVLFGHSMGSYIAQAAVMREPAAYAALVLSGSDSPPRLRLRLGRLAARLEAFRHGRRYPSPALNAQAFGAYNRRFEPARTGFDWLSRDPAEVDRYVADPLCGAVPTAGLWIDLLGGLLEIGRRRSLIRVPAVLPVLITGGGDDPVGGSDGMRRLGERYRGTGHADVTVEVFDGGRHEMLNEVNRDEFTAFVRDWMGERLWPKASKRGLR